MGVCVPRQRKKSAQPTILFSPRADDGINMGWQAKRERDRDRDIERLAESGREWERVG